MTTRTSFSRARKSPIIACFILFEQIAHGAETGVLGDPKSESSRTLEELVGDAIVVEGSVVKL